MRTLTAVCLLSFGFAAPLAADGFNRAHVPATARSVAHVDVEALLRSQVVAEMQKLDPEFKLDFDLGEHHPMLKGFQPLKQVRSVTLFAADIAKERMGAVLRVDSRFETVLQVAAGLEQYGSMDVGGQLVHTWNGEDDVDVYAAVLPIAGSSDRLVLVTNDTTLLGSGLATLTGHGASLADGAKGLLASVPQPGAILFAASSQSLAELGDVDPSSSVARLVQGAVLQFGEQSGTVFGNLSLLTEQPQDALRLLQVLQGLTALAGLIGEEGHGQSVQRLVSGLSFQAAGSQLYVEFRYDLQSLVQELRTLHDQAR
jgi:hypothetical protein